MKYIIQTKDLNKKYKKHEVNKDISLKVPENSIYGLLGPNGAGKSTLLKMISGMINPTSGEIYINDYNITDNDLNLTEVRKRVGIVFQYPEYQLFEETVEKDIAFGPSNLNLSDEEIALRVKESMKAVGLNYEEYKDKSPFDLSGGQKRRVAIAGVIAMKPELLILDEPTNHLDQDAKDELKKALRQYQGTIILVSHEPYFYEDFVDEIWDMSKYSLVKGL